MIGKILKELRKKNGWSQKELAERLGTTRAAVAKWETGEANPPYKMLVKLAQLTPPCELLGQNNDIECECQGHNPIYRVYPKIIVVCPAERREQRGQECLGCRHYRGIRGCWRTGAFFIECDFREDEGR